MTKLDLQQILKETSKSVTNGHSIQQLEKWKEDIKNIENKEDKKSLGYAISILETVIELKKKKKSKSKIFFFSAMFVFIIFSLSFTNSYPVTGVLKSEVEFDNETFYGNLIIDGNLDLTRNVTFEKDVNILGKLYGGSPVKIAGGMNITTGNFYLAAGNLHVDGDLIHDIGDVFFSGGDFDIDDGSFFVDVSNNRIGIGTTEPARLLHLQDDNAVIRIDRDTNSPAFILARFPNNNYTTPWKSFIFGVAATSEDNGTFHITDIGTKVSGGGDRRLTIENDGTVDVPGNFIADKIYLQDSGSYYIDWRSGDDAFVVASSFDVGGTLFANDISGGIWTGSTIDATNEVMTPVIYNTDGDTLTVQDNLDVNGAISNSDGLLKIQPDVQGDVELFGDTQVGNGENGKMFYVRRQAAEGNDYIRMYVSSGRNSYIHSDRDLTLQGQQTFTINAVTKDIIFKVGDNAGAKKFYFRDSDANNIATIDSDGNSYFAESMGIGTANPTQKLDVIGSIRSSLAYLFSDGSTQISAQDGFFGHITTAVFNKNFSTANQDTSPRDMHFKPDGTKLYISGVQGDGIVWEYDLTDPFNVSSMIYNSKSFNVETWENNPMGLFFRHDGLKMYICGSGGDEVNEFNLSIAWDITSAEWVNLFDVSGNETQPAGVGFRPDGKKMYIIGTSSDAVNEYDLSTPWDITTSVSYQEFGIDIDSPTGFSFSQDGTRMYVMDGSDEDDIHEYILSTPWDISTARLERLFNVSSQNGVPQDIAFSPDMTKVYMLGSTSPASVFEYDLGISINGKSILYGPLEVNDDISYIRGTQNSILMTGDPSGTYIKFGGQKQINQIGTFMNQPFGIVSNSVERITVEAGGDVGIGTDNPTSTLDIHGDLSFAQTLGDKISLYDDRIGDANMYGFGVEVDSALYSKSYSRYRWYINSNIDGGNSSLMSLNTAGLGLGTDDPKEELHIKSSGPKITFEESDAGSNEKVWEIGASGEEFKIITANDLHSGTQTAMRIGRAGTSINSIEFPHGDVTIADLSGSGNDYACIDSTGKLFRSNTAC